MKDLRLTGPRVVIREWNDGDATAILAYAADPDVVRFMPWGPHTPIEVAEFLLATEASRDENPRKKYEMAVTLRETNEVIGGAGIRVMNGENRHGEIGYVLRRDAWGAGYGTEIAGLLLTFGFSKLALHRISAGCDVENYGSERVMQKNGMRLEGRFRHNVFRRGEWRDSLLYAICEDER
ncbi:MAG: GNAT family N-acetyltransferase [Actinomycetota bacterium]